MLNGLSIPNGNGLFICYDIDNQINTHKIERATAKKRKNPANIFFMLRKRVA